MEEGEEDLKNINLEFRGARDYQWDSAKKEVDIDYDAIISITQEGNCLKFVLDGEKVSILTFKCDKVEIH